MDDSASMGSLERKVGNNFSLWTQNILKSIYSNIEFTYMLFNTTARVVSKEEFKHDSTPSGTIVSFALKEVIKFIDDYNYANNYKKNRYICILNF